MIIGKDKYDGKPWARFTDDHKNDPDFLVERDFKVNGVLVPALGIDVDDGGGPTYTLSQQKAAELWPVLKRFAETGTIRETE